MTISIHVYRVMFVLAWLAVAVLAWSKVNAADLEGGFNSSGITSSMVHE